MVAVPSTMLPLGQEAPPFKLKDEVSEKEISLENHPEAKAYLVMFICNHCPFVKHLHPELSTFCKTYQDKGVAVFAISSNDIDHYPDDSPKKMKEEATRQGFSFPYLHDETQEVAKTYEAACTPDFFLFNADKKLVYRGQFDDSRPGNDIKVTGDSLGKAIDEVLSGKTPEESTQKASIGCSIKWKQGKAPAYFAQK